MDDPRFEGFAFGDGQSLLDGRIVANPPSDDDPFKPSDFTEKGREWTPDRLAHVWKPPRVVGRVRRSNDFPCVGLIIPAFSRRAVDALRDLLEPNGELLLLDSSVGEYYAYNVTTKADVLDSAGTEVWSFQVLRYEFRVERLKGLSIFRIPESISTVFVTDSFVARVREHDLLGFDFIKVWPWAPGTRYWEENRKERLRSKEDADLPVKGNTVVLRLPLAKKTPNVNEKQLLNGLLDRLDALLDEKMPGPYYGSLEGHSKQKGEIRVFLSCPNCDRLLEKLRPELVKLRAAWPIQVVKRYGEMRDRNCREEYVDIGGN